LRLICADRPLGAGDALSDRAGGGIIFACAVVLRREYATARASGAPRTCGAAEDGTFASASEGDAGRYARGAAFEPALPTDGCAARYGRECAPMRWTMLRSRTTYVWTLRWKT
jgi:hypothetical protein